MKKISTLFILIALCFISDISYAAISDNTKKFGYYVGYVAECTGQYSITTLIIDDFIRRNGDIDINEFDEAITIGEDDAKNKGIVIDSPQCEEAIKKAGFKK